MLADEDVEDHSLIVLNEGVLLSGLSACCALPVFRTLWEAAGLAKQ